MIITLVKIQEKNKNKCNVYIDGEYSFAVSLDCAVKYSLKAGKEISNVEIEEIKTESDRQEAFNLALKYLAKALKTKKQVKDYLAKKGFSLDIIYKVIDRLKELNFINDIEYAKRFAEYSSKSEGKRLSDYKLMQKGVSKKDIESARQNLTVDTMSTAFKLAEKRLKNKEITLELLSKTYRYLIGKGFSYEEVDSALKPFKEN